MVRLYETTQDEKYLNTAKELWGYIEGGWNEEYGDGGVAWRADQPWSKMHVQMVRQLCWQCVCIL